LTKSNTLVILNNGYFTGSMEIQLKYGHHIVSCHLPDDVRSNVLEPPNNAPVPSIEQALISSINKPVHSESLSSMITAGEKITIVVPDKTRQCVLDRILPVLYDHLITHGAIDENITILFANGTHQAQSDKEMEQLLGSFLWKKLRVEQHNSLDDNSLEYVGTTSRGTEVHVNKLVTEADLVITVGGILHHYFAGFGGGPKLLVPGVASYETAKKNHSYTIDENGAFQTECREGNLDTNPVFSDIKEAIKMIPNVFSINVVLDASDKIAGFFSGDIIAAHRKGTELASALYEVPVKELADIVVVSPGGAPRDSTFIQSHKAIHHAYNAVKPGGSVIVTAACYDGIGSSTFLKWFSIPHNLLGGKLLTDYSLNGHTALALRTKLNRIGISLLSYIDNATVSKMGVIPVSSLQATIDTILQQTVGSPKIYILPHGSLTVPTTHD